MLAISKYLYLSRALDLRGCGTDGLELPQTEGPVRFRMLQENRSLRGESEPVRRAIRAWRALFE